MRCLLYITFYSFCAMPVAPVYLRSVLLTIMYYPPNDPPSSNLPSFCLPYAQRVGCVSGCLAVLQSELLMTHIQSKKGKRRKGNAVAIGVG